MSSPDLITADLGRWRQAGLPVLEVLPDGLVIGPPRKEDTRPVSHAGTCAVAREVGTAARPLKEAFAAPDFGDLGVEACLKCWQDPLMVQFGRVVWALRAADDAFTGVRHVEPLRARDEQGNFKFTPAQRDGAAFMARRFLQVPNANGEVPLTLESVDSDRLLGSWWPDLHGAAMELLEEHIAAVRAGQVGWDGPLEMLTPAVSSMSLAQALGVDDGYPEELWWPAAEVAHPELVKLLLPASSVGFVRRPGPDYDCPVFAVPAGVPAQWLAAAGYDGPAWVSLGPLRSGPGLRELLAAFEATCGQERATQPVVDALLTALS